MSYLTNIKTSKTLIPKHNSYDEMIGHPDKSWFYYKVHLPGDKKIEMRLAVLIFKLS